jgi:hypothetical protein
VSVTGNDKIQALFLYDANGDPLTYANHAAFISDGWLLAWYDAANAAISPQPDYEVQAGDSAGRHPVIYTIPSGPWTVKITKPSTLHTNAPLEFEGEGFAYDFDSIGSSMAVAAGFTVTDYTSTSSTEIYHGDSIQLDFSVAESALTLIGASSLADVTTLAVEIKRTSVDSSTAADVATLTESIMSDIGGNRIVRGTLAAFPAILAPPTGGQTTLACRADLRLTKGSNTITASTIDITVKWKATT